MSEKDPLDPPSTTPSKYPRDTEGNDEEWQRTGGEQPLKEKERGKKAPQDSKRRQKDAEKDRDA